MKKIVIIGAGLIGCFCARALSEYDLDITVLESRDDVCAGISKAGSGIVYAGYDTKPGTTKSALCINSNRRFRELCETLGVRYRKCGSLMVGFGPKADETIRRKLDNGRIGGISGLKVISREEALELEPGLNKDITTALFSEKTGTVNPWELCIAAYECAVANGVKFIFNETVQSLERADDNGFEIGTDSTTYRADVVVNCAGIYSDRIRELCEKPLIRIVPTAADYLVTDSSLGGFIKHVVFHEPEEGKGLTIVPTVDGNLLIGATERQAADISTATDEDGIETLKRLCSEVVPDLPMNKIIRSYGCMRPNPYYVNEDGSLIEKKSISELKLIEENGLFSFIGVKTPGMTMAPELGRYLTEKIVARDPSIRVKSDYDPGRTAITRVASISDEDRAQFVSDNPEYGHIICRCEGISEGEIREAIRRGARTVEAVKRRTSAGMGRCQGSYCRQQILQMLEEDN